MKKQQQNKIQKCGKIIQDFFFIKKLDPFFFKFNQ
jgi:hypothetical protein